MFSASLQVLAREGRHVELEAKMDALYDLLDAWLDVAPPKADRPERIRLFALFDRFHGPLDIDMRDVAQQGVLSGDTTTLKVLADGIKSFAFRCIHREQLALAQEYFDCLIFLYYRCRDNGASLDAVGMRLDSTLDSLLTAATYPEDKLNAKPTDTTVMAFRFALALVNAAIQLRQPRFAGYFVDRLLKVREHRMRYQFSRSQSQVSLTTEVLLDFVFVLAIGWSLEVLENANAKYHPAAQTVLQEAQTVLPSRECLIAEWELLHDDDVQDSHIGARLGVSNWDASDWDREVRTGIVTTRMGGGDWSKTGLLASLLLSTEHSWQNVDELCGGPADRFAWSVNAEREALQKLAAKSELSIPEGEREKRIESILELISQRSQGGDANYLAYVLDTPLSDQRTHYFEKQVIDSWAKHRPWIDAIGERIDRSSKPAVMPPTVVQRAWVPREYFLDDNNWASGFGDHLGEAVGRQECVNLIGKLEDVASSGEDIQALASLPEVIRRAVRSMADDGFTANWLILPQEDRFAGALFRKPLWQIEGRGQYSGASIGDWEGLHVLRCPYTDPKAILLVDTSKAFAGSIAADPRQARVVINGEPAEGEAKERRDSARRALAENAEGMPKSSDIVALARMTVDPSLGIAERTAAIKLSIENSDGGFAITPDSALYHRPSCPDIAFEEVEYVLSAPARSGRKPCPTCEPEKWNWEARRGQPGREDTGGQ